MFLTETMLTPCINIAAIATPSCCLKLGVLMTIMIAFGKALVAKDGVVTLSAVEATICGPYLCLVDALRTDGTN